MANYHENKPEEFLERLNLGEHFSRESARIKKVLRTCAVVVLVLLAACGVWFLARNFRELYGIFTSDDPAAAMDQFLDGNRLLGVLVIFFVQVVQVLFAFIPGGPMQMVAGALYGGFFGGLILLAGAAAASFIIWSLVSRLGQAAIEAFHDRKSASRLLKIRAFREEKSAETLTWILFLIPGVPKDLLTYFAPLTPMKRGRFILISTIARIPGIFLTTFASSSLMNGNFWASAALYILMFGGALAGGWYYRRLHSGQPERTAEDKTGDKRKDERN